MQLDKNIDQIFQLVNRVRTNPSEFIDKYSPSLNKYNGKIYKDTIKTREGVDALKDLFNDLKRRTKIEQPLKWSFGLHMAADAQAKKLGVDGLLTTEATNDHRKLPQRVKDYAVVKGKLTEVLQFGGATGEQVVQWLLIDDGLSSRKRRSTLLDPIFKYIGIGCCLHKVHGFVTVIILGEQVTSLVAPGREGFFIKREVTTGDKLRSFLVQEKKKNEKTIEKTAVEYYNANRVIAPRMVASNIIRQ